VWAEKLRRLPMREAARPRRRRRSRIAEHAIREIDSEVEVNVVNDAFVSEECAALVTATVIFGRMDNPFTS
jgi:hypothetical protein